MRQAITTKYRVNHNTGTSSIYARSAQGKSLRVPWDHSLDVEGNHNNAARALASKLKWDGTWHGGSLDKAGYVFVNLKSDTGYCCFVVPRTE